METPNIALVSAHFSLCAVDGEEQRKCRRRLFPFLVKSTPFLRVRSPHSDHLPKEIVERFGRLACDVHCQVILRVATNEYHLRKHH